MQDIGDDILTEVDAAGIATVTLNRAQKRNALTLAMWRRLGDIFDNVGRRADVRVVVLTGTDGNFSAGADISEFAQVRNTVEAGRIYEAATEAATIAVRDCPKPTIAAVCGFGVGGVCGLALACDVRVPRAWAFQQRGSASYMGLSTAIFFSGRSVSPMPSSCSSPGACLGLTIA